MSVHLQQIKLALQVIWGQSTVSLRHRLGLLKKTLNLYLSLLAFADIPRTGSQLRRVMICAIGTSIYDYETDWVANDDRPLLTDFIERYIWSRHAREIAYSLFDADAAKKLSEDGLERGSVALQFYFAVIESHWMTSYTYREIDEFGADLQILDDWLDLPKDKLTGDKNCFVCGGNARYYKERLQQLLDSEFFSQLKSNSLIYRWLGYKIQRELGVRRSRTGKILGLLSACRLTTGIYAAVLSLIGCKFLPVPSEIAAIQAVAFFLLTSSIMVFNDWMDRFHDCRKNKWFARMYIWEIRWWWWTISGWTATSIAWLLHHNGALAAFCLGVWVTGLAYSFTRKLFPLNNIIVAICAACPVIGSSVYHGHLSSSAGWTFSLLFSIILLNEACKDFEDGKIDQGYKSTAVTVLSPSMAFAWTYLCLGLMVATLLAYPNNKITAVAVVAVPLLILQHPLVFAEPLRLARLKLTLRYTIVGVLAILLLG